MARLRWKIPGERLPSAADYRPATLSTVRSNLDDVPAINFEEFPAGSFRLHTIEAGETLSAIAQAEYGAADKWRLISDANRSRIVSPDEIFIGQQIKIPTIAVRPPE
jgi:nucleoid-associated protein YgaU